MSIKLKIITLLVIINILIFKIIIPIVCIIKILLNIGQPDFYATFANYFLYGILSLIIEALNLPAMLLNKKDKQWLYNEIERIKNTNKQKQD